MVVGWGSRLKLTKPSDECHLLFFLKSPKAELLQIVCLVVPFWEISPDESVHFLPAFSWYRRKPFWFTDKHSARKTRNPSLRVEPVAEVHKQWAPPTRPAVPSRLLVGWSLVVLLGTLYGAFQRVQEDGRGQGWMGIPETLPTPLLVGPTPPTRPSQQAWPRGAGPAVHPAATISGVPGWEAGSA